MSDATDFVKILFRFFSKVLEQETVETMWAKVVNEEKGLYKIDSIPFYAPSLASGDIVSAKYSEAEQMLTYRDTVEYSDSSTVWVVLMQKSVKVDDIRGQFEAMNCLSEKLNDSYFAMEVPGDINYKVVKAKLKELEAQNLIEYAEPCLSNKHRF